MGGTPGSGCIGPAFQVQKEKTIKETRKKSEGSLRIQENGRLENVLDRMKGKKTVNRRKILE